jgi:hypothetical protein
MSADTQETRGDFVTFVEKLSIQRTGNYELCIGGAGRTELINGFIQLVTERIRKAKPENDEALAATIRGALAYFYRNDVALFPGKDEDKETQFLIAARSNAGETSLWKTEGIRVYPVNTYATTGHEPPFCEHVIGRVYDPNIPLDNAVLLSVWLVSIAKATSVWAGGSTGIVIVDRNGIYSKTPDELKALEATVKAHDEILSLTMSLTADCLAKQMGSKAPRPSFGLTDGKLKLSYPSVQPLPLGYVNYFEFDRFRNLAAIGGFVSSASTSIRSGKIIPSPTTKALLNETILELNSAQSKALEWHNAAVEVQSLGAILPDCNGFEYAFQQVRATFLIYLAYVMKELFGEVMQSTPR